MKRLAIFLWPGICFFCPQQVLQHQQIGNAGDKIMNFTKTLLSGSAVALVATFASLGASTSAQAATICPTTFNTNTDCGYILTIASNGGITGSPVANANPYDGSDDTLVGVINNMTTPFTGSIFLSGSGNGGGIFGFDGDGICTYINAGNASMLSYCTNSQKNGNDPGDYQGPINTFSNISLDETSGTVNITGLAAGGTTFFSLEGSPASIRISTQVPEPITLSLFGAGLAGAAFIRRRKAAKEA
jgi:hypothetical protein